MQNFGFVQNSLDFGSLKINLKICWTVEKAATLISKHALRNSTPDFFRQPSIGIQEYPLDISGKTAKADFRFEFAESGLLFIEDEDDNAQRALNNLVKYWRWCKENPKYQPVHVISICGPENINTDNFKFLKEKIETDLKYFKCHLINHRGSGNWHKAGADWHKELEDIYKKITSN